MTEETQGTETTDTSISENVSTANNMISVINAGVVDVIQRIPGIDRATINQVMNHVTTKGHVGTAM